MNFSENDVNDILQWRHLLLSLSGYELHLKTYRSSNHNYNVLHQVLINENFPHSILYSLIRIDHYLNKAINNKMNEDSLALLRTFGKLLSKVKFISLEAFDHTSIQAFLKELKSDLMVFNKQLGQHFFSYS